MLPYRTLIPLSRESTTSLYIQLSNGLVKCITSGVIPTGTKLPGGRKMGVLLGLSRRTVIQAYEELESQGWVDIVPSKGVRVKVKLPIYINQTLVKKTGGVGVQESYFELDNNLDFLDHITPASREGIKYVFDTGYPDVRLSPKKELAQSFQRVLNSSLHAKLLNYAPTFKGNDQLISEIIKYLASTRGVSVTADNLIITRGSLMAFNAIFRILLSPNDVVIVGDVSFKIANDIIGIARGKLMTVPVDDDGLVVTEIAKICRTQTIRAVFVMPHHHHPTTVSMSAERRMLLLQLAVKYGFAIIEDDYDYDFHYNSSPILPMASADQFGTVIYVGSLSKTVAPGLRTGFIVASQNVIKELSRISRFIDCHGNPVLEKAIANLFQEGVIRRHLKKSLKTYRKRRDHFCQLLKDELTDYVSFNIPDGGLAVWVKFIPEIPLAELRMLTFKNELLISRTVFKGSDGRDINAIRMGFASMNEEELSAAVSVLKLCIEKILIHTSI